MGPRVPPFSPPKTSTPPIAAEAATHLAAEMKTRRSAKLSVRHTPSESGISSENQVFFPGKLLLPVKNETRGNDRSS